MAWLIALLSTLSALFIGEVMGQTPCNLCWFQRAFMFPLAIILTIACLNADLSAWRYALPIAVVGWAIAAYHMALYAGLIPAALEPCGDGPSCSSANMLLFGRLPIPLLAFAAFTAITILLDRIRRSSAT